MSAHAQDLASAAEPSAPTLAGDPARRRRLGTTLFPAGDIVAVVVATVATDLCVWWANGERGVLGVGPGSGLLLFLPLCWVLLSKAYGLYNRDSDAPETSTVDELVSLSQVAVGSVWLGAAVAALTHLHRPELSWLLTFSVLATALVAAGRTGMRAVVRRSSHYVQNVLVIGADTRTELIAGKLATHPEYRFNVVGSVAVTPNGTETDGSETSSGSVGALDQLPDLVRRLGVERIILASPDRANGRLISTIHSLTDLGLHVDIVPELYHVLGPRSHLRTLDGIRLLSIAPPNVSRSSLAAKRVLDASLGAVLLFLFAPLFAYIAIRLKIDSRGPVVYRQERLGRHGRTFRILKFRTMYSDQCRGPEYGGEKAEEMFRDLLRSSEREQEFEQSYKLRDDPRVTPFGAWLRKTSLDELPQLVNVLLGQMSLVGPRPIVADELARYGEYGGKLLSFRPGMTGHWQINGRSRVPYPERVRLDFAYISNWSLWLDITTLAKTLRALRCGGAV